jgi:hypothetical protein
MIRYDGQPVNSESRWQTVAELSLRGELGCEHEALEKVEEILVSIHIPDRVLAEAKQAVAKVVEKAMSNIVVEQVQRTFTILVQTQLAQSLETPAAEADSSETHSPSRGWNFFLTEKRISETKLGNPMYHIVINVHLYHEGRQA